MAALGLRVWRSIALACMDTAETLSQTSYQHLSSLGMIEATEWDLLVNAARHLKENEYILEYGTFLGVSTMALASGLHPDEPGISSHHSNPRRLYTFDSYKCKTDNIYGHIVSQAAAKVGFDLQAISGEYHYQDLVRRIIEPYKDIISLNQGRIEDSNIPSELLNMKLGILHLDAPKDWSLLSKIFQKCMSLLAKDSLIVEQDMFFECSPEVIYAFWYLESHNIASYFDSAASTAYYRWNISEPIDSSELIQKIGDHLNLCRTNRNYYIENTNSIINFFLRAGLVPNQLIALAAALINFAASTALEENLKIGYCFDIYQHFKLGETPEFMPKLFRVLSRSKQAFAV